MKGKILGLEIGKDYLAALVIERSFKGYSIKESFYSSYDELSALDDTIGYAEAEAVNTDLFEAALTVLARSINIKSCSVVGITIPAASISFRTINLPFASKTKIRQILSLELASNLPLSDENYVSDFILSHSKTVNNQNEILTASVLESFIDRYFHPLEAMGLKPGLITAHGYAAADYLLKIMKTNGNTVFIDIAVDSMTVTLSVNQRIAQIRSLGKKNSHDLLVQGVNHTITGFNLRSGFEFIPETCVIVSTNKTDDLLCQKITDVLGCPAVYARQTLDGNNLLLPNDTPYMNALSAAVASSETRPILNFCRGRYSADSIFKKYFLNFLSVSIFAFFMIMAFIFNLYSDISILDKRISELENDAIAVFKVNFPNAAKITHPLMEMKVKVKQAREKSSADFHGDQASGSIHHRVVDILYSLSTQIPDPIDIETTRLVLNPGRIVLSGTTDNYNNVDKIKGHIEQCAMVKQVRISSATAEKTGNRVMFKFIIDI